ncbi:hypothetical protein PR202_ga18144 [Eleusine coracana subsp. coracana]|uniref:Uncharacterized protein n=1 Tax=Eleusine coracana subsp. coracana TaxID=191504 RepID=A0AAV5CR13_ELECO|nr:hypothetical protein PR202_ga18144 [Eleusine coracana subsp. coracana]
MELPTQSISSIVPPSGRTTRHDTDAESAETRVRTSQSTRALPTCIGSKHMKESAVSRTLVPDEAAPALSLLGLRAPAREEIEADRLFAVTVEAAPPWPPSACCWDRRAASSVRRRVRSSTGGAIFGGAEQREGTSCRPRPARTKKGDLQSTYKYECTTEMG